MCWQKQLLMVNHWSNILALLMRSWGNYWPTLSSLWPAGRVIQPASVRPTLTNWFTQRPINVIKDKSGTIKNN